MNNKQKLVNLCIVSMKRLGLDKDKRYIDKLKHEFIELDSNDDFDYFLEHYEKGSHWNGNHHNVLVSYLLGLCDEFDIERETDYVMTDFPDIDIDYIDSVRDYLRNEWAPKTFGADKVCMIGTYGTYQLKQSLLDMARIFNKDHHEIQEITRNFESKDDEGDLLTWDKAVELYPAFKEYIEKNPEVAEAAKKIHGKEKNQGKHAGGFVVSSVPIAEFVPLMTSKDGEDNVICTAYSEGQRYQELQLIGLIKLDLLNSRMHEQVVECVHLVKTRHKLKSFFALDGQSDWSDESYLNDAESLKQANNGNVRFVYQFDSSGIRKLTKQVGVSSFNDLVAITALYRPAALTMGLHDVFANRKNGIEKYELHPVLENVIGKSYGIMVFQENVMQILNCIGNISKRDTYDVIKAISKKKDDKIEKYKIQFTANCQKTLGYTEEQAVGYFEEIEKWAKYGFNKSHSVAYTLTSMRQLFLKTHYPYEFFVTLINKIQGLDYDEKIRDCKRCATAHGVRISRVDVNYSNYKCSIADDKFGKECIYFGFSSLKFVGEDDAKQIVAEREKRGVFTDFADFLKRTNVKSKTVLALVSLHAFGDGLNNLKAYSFYESYKDYQKKVDAFIKRYELITTQKFKNDLQAIIGPFNDDLSIEFFEKILISCDNDQAKLINKIYTKYKTSSSRYQEKFNNIEDNRPKYFDFQENTEGLKKEVLDVLTNSDNAEMLFYGFIWSHPIELSPDAEGLTFSHLEEQRLGVNEHGCVEGLIVESKIAKFKKSGKEHGKVKLMDANWISKEVVFWLNDYQSFENELIAGNLVRISVSPPNMKYGGFAYTFESLSRFRKFNPDNDFRLIVLKKN